MPKFRKKCIHCGVPIEQEVVRIGSTNGDWFHAPTLANGSYDSQMDARWSCRSFNGMGTEATPRPARVKVKKQKPIDFDKELRKRATKKTPKTPLGSTSRVSKKAKLA